VDLRPNVSHAFRDKSDMLDKVMKGNRWYISDPKEAVRYFEDDEIDERKGLYNILTEIREKVEIKKLKFCGCFLALATFLIYSELHVL
jgi:hypothetical protein